MYLQQRRPLQSTEGLQAHPSFITVGGQKAHGDVTIPVRN
jgi:hypothetical protein